MIMKLVNVSALLLIVLWAPSGVKRTACAYVSQLFVHSISISESTSMIHLNVDVSANHTCVLLDTIGTKRHVIVCALPHPPHVLMLIFTGIVNTANVCALLKTVRRKQYIPSMMQKAAPASALKIQIMHVNQDNILIIILINVFVSVHHKTLA